MKSGGHEESEWHRSSCSDRNLCHSRRVYSDVLSTTLVAELARVPRGARTHRGLPAASATKSRENDEKTHI